MNEVSSLSKNLLDILQCPFCNRALQFQPHKFICNGCNSIYTYGEIYDFRLPRKKNHSIHHCLGSKPPKHFKFNYLSMKDDPEVNYGNTPVPYHLTKELMSHFPKAKTSNSLMLDLGCADSPQKKVCEIAGFEYIGLDYSNSKATILGDAHSLPFKDNSFEFVLSIAVLEHLINPFVALSEVFRVLKKNGKFIGTVAFMEPFHCDSYYHFTHLGLLSSLNNAGFVIESISPTENWTAIDAIKKMIISGSDDSDTWKKLNREIRKNSNILNYNGSYSFIAYKR